MEYFYFIYFLLHIPITIVIDATVVIPLVSVARKAGGIPPTGQRWFPARFQTSVVQIFCLLGIGPAIASLCGLCDRLLAQLQILSTVVPINYNLRIQRGADHIHLSRIHRPTRGGGVGTSPVQLASFLGLLTNIHDPRRHVRSILPKVCVSTE